MRPSPSPWPIAAIGVCLSVLGSCGGSDDSIRSRPLGREDNPDASLLPEPSDGGREVVDPDQRPTVTVGDAGLARCDNSTEPTQPLQLTPIVTGLTNPLYVTASPGDDSRLFVVEQAGVIRIVQDGQLLPEPFLDISDRVRTYATEDGLVGLAFHPDYATNGRFYVHYSTEQVGADPLLDAGAADAGLSDAGPQDAGLTDVDAGLFIASGASVISEFQRSADADHARADSERRILIVNQLLTNHNGGMVTFGLTDRLLYLGMGDGDGIGDVNRQAQNLSTLTGKVLRLDVDNPTDGRAYGIPAGNMTGAGVRPEIWSYGLRNPWRFSFDPCNDDLYLGDVGQYAMEEINYEPGNREGHNYGWNIVEGNLCYSPSSNCDMSGIQMPVVVYGRDRGCAVTAGYVYRGEKIPSLRGAYLYSDYCTGRFSTFRMRAGVATEHQDITDDLNPTGLINFDSFGIDNHGELYAVTHGGGVYRIDPE
jgi:glucose/arabinose dehydrogenase